MLECDDCFCENSRMNWLNADLRYLTCKQNLQARELVVLVKQTPLASLSLSLSGFLWVPGQSVGERRDRHVCSSGSVPQRG